MNTKPLLLLALLVLSSCSTFKEVHYFSDNTPGIPNYYRVKVSGLSFLSSSRYISGYFDPDAVNQYFNETKQPEKGRLGITAFNANSQYNGLSTAPDTGKIKKSYLPVQAPAGKERLVLIYSTSSDAVSNHLGLITQNEATMDVLGFLLQENKYGDSQKIEIQNAISLKKNSMLLGLGAPLVDALDTTDSQGKVNSSLLQFVNVLAAELGNLTPFPNWEEAEIWLERNRSGILNSAR